MDFLNRKNLVLMVVFSLAGELVSTIGVLAAEYFDWLHAAGQAIVFWLFFPLICLAIGWLSRRYQASWLLALLVPILIYVPFILVIMDTPIFLLFVPLYCGLSLGIFFLIPILNKRLHPV